MDPHHHDHINNDKDLHQLKKYEEAIQAFDQAIKLDPNQNAEAYARKGLALSYLSKYKDSIICCDQAIKINPNDATAYFGKGRSL